MNNKNLPIDLLRTLITISEVGGYTRAAALLGRTQPAISLQIKRLDQLLGVKLLTQSGQKTELSDDGQRLAVYARQILRLNDEAVAQFSVAPLDGSLRVGLPTDFSTAYLQDAILQFGQKTPDTQLKIHCGLSANLLDELHRGEHDVIVALHCDEDNQYLSHQWIQQPLWVSSEGFKLAKDQPVPIIAHYEGCPYRDRMTSVLSRERRRWDIVFAAPGVAELQSAVLSSFGVTALTGKTLLKGMKVLPANEGYPSLPAIHVGIFCRHSQTSQAGLLLVEQLSRLLSGLTEEPSSH
ncbi:MAG: LysR substrate-binding domain-containing protein [Granulosicoccaceae bacterium]